MNQNSTIMSLSPIYPTSAFRPMQTKQWSSSKNISSIISPIVEKSPLMPQTKNDLRLQTTFLENSMNTNKNYKSSFPTKAGTLSHNPMNIQFDSFSPPEKTIKEFNFHPPSFGINQSFFQLQTPQKQGFAFSEINTFLYKHTSEKKRVKESEMLKNYYLSPQCDGVLLDLKDGRNNIKVNRLNFNKQINTHGLFENNSQNQNKKITNVINNFYIQLPEKNKTQNFFSPEQKIKNNINKKVINKKRGRKNILGSVSKPKKIKKIDKTTFNMNFNQINIKNISLLKYPIISISEEELNVEIYARLLTEENYFKCEKMKNYNLIIPTLELSNETFINYFTQKLNSNKNLCLLEENKDVILPYDIIRNYYSKIKKTIMTIQKNFIGKRKGILNKEQCDILYNLIKTMNYISEIICSYSFSGFNKKNLLQEENNDNNSSIIDNQEDDVRNKFNENIIHSASRKLNNTIIIPTSKDKEIYECPFCLKTFDKGQKLGGHMSRNHPNQSEKYKEKMIIRNRRTKNRKLLAIIKEKFLRKYEKDINQLNKGDIQMFLKNHKIEYIQFKKQEQKEHKNKFEQNEFVEGFEEYEDKNNFNVFKQQTQGDIININNTTKEVNFQVKRPLFKNLVFEKQ